MQENGQRDRRAPEFELIDTGAFDGDRYFDVVVEYGKAAPDDVLVRITATNRGPEAAELHLLPTLWYRNTWSWDTGGPERPTLRAGRDSRHAVIEAEHPSLGARWLYCEGGPELLFTENDTNTARLFDVPNARPYVKDSINACVVEGRKDAVNPERLGTKAAAYYRPRLEPGQSVVTRLRLSNTPLPSGPFGKDFDTVFGQRVREADEFYQTVVPKGLSDDAKSVMRQAFAGLLWSKQFYQYDVRRWLEGDPACPPPPPGRSKGRNHEWQHLYNEDVISMPDKWEYPWYAAWDLAFHTIPLALVDPDFAKAQLILFLREWYMHPNGQIPAYEWALGDVNPPVHAWAALRVYRIERRLRGKGDREFLERVFHKLLLNFTWWVNRKDAEGKNIFQGGFLGLDNIGVFDRSAPLPTGGHIEQSDGTSWMGMYCLNMLAIALELAKQDPAYEDVASKFFEHFVYIAHAVDNPGEGINLWDEADGFYYDVLHGNGTAHPMKVRSMVGLIRSSRWRRSSPRSWINSRASSGGCSGSSTTTRSFEITSRWCPSLASGCAGSWRSSGASSSRASWGSCWTKRSSSRRTASARCRATTRIIPTRSVSTGWSIASTTSRPSPPADSSAATRTGAVRSGSR